jgi:uncharacterized membrane protein affecting hemolysin expression
VSPNKSVSLYHLLRTQGWKLSIYITLVVTAVFFFLWWIIGGTVDRNIERIIKTYGQSVTNGIAFALSEPLSKKHTPTIQSSIDALADDETILAIEVYEETGELLAQMPQTGDELLFVDKKYQESYSRYGKHPRLFVKSVMQDGKRLGFIAVKLDISRLDMVNKKVTHRTLVAGILGCLILIGLIHIYFRTQIARLKFT